MACGVEHNTVIVGNFQVVIALNWPFSAYLLNPLTCTSINIYGIVSFEHTIHACVCVEVGLWSRAQHCDSWNLSGGHSPQLAFFCLRT